jgi:hypothetical protein
MKDETWKFSPSSISDKWENAENTITDGARATMQLHTLYRDYSEAPILWRRTSKKVYPQ